ncbi:hydrogenase maturation nickel metallochaperone HypA [Candidatus Woesearchaeota archaeon]|nr:hydrogenase maturation nickel metallochaperone HypA [Candidatus Woesearchaeota archaeon]HIH37711.1 hydrogenase maturation nickel metallochaperone HypA [Candidatus Woesearchaeota archaeon]HIH48252.1 hydrogenase maturation nickel metallochaperone HypA [Candidatus Woesearchaeota archaeon]HIJ03264.1 hydrogenase maturation nickel metallochaperone HypA [Candidatus Woesearchaeota archaeon]
MHESTICAQIIEEAKKLGNVKGITLECGALAHVPAHDLEDTMKHMCDWEIKIVEKKARVKCACGFMGEPKILEYAHDYAIFQCPTCGKVPKVLDGTDIKLLHVEVD